MPDTATTGPAPDARPTMTERDLGLHLARAGRAARDTAAREASDPVATSALRDAATPVVAARGGMELGRLTFGALWVLRDAGSVFASTDANGPVTAHEAGLAILVLADPIAAHVIQQRDGNAALWDMAARLAFQDLDPAAGAAALQWVNAEFARANAAASNETGSGAAPKKPTPGIPGE
jgi:hypothetical protein